MKFFLKTIVILLLSTAILSSKGIEKKIIVNLTKQEAFAYENNKLVLKGWISSGREEFKTPQGKYRVLAKEKFHISNEWPQPTGGAEMPYMLRLTWSGIALHLGYVPNYPASHGCVRLKNGFAQELFKWADIGTRVIIKGKQTKHVSRKHRSAFYMTKYFYKKYKTSYNKEHKYLAKLSKELKRLSKAHHIAMKKERAKQNKKLVSIKKRKSKKYISMAKKVKLKKHLAKKRKRVTHKHRIAFSKIRLIRYYSKFSYRKLNRILRANYIKKRKILASKINKRDKLKRLKKITRVLKIIKQAKYTKRHRKYKKRFV